MSSAPLITSPSHPLIKQARSLRQGKARASSGSFLVEGIHHVGEALESGWEVISILYAPDQLVSAFGRELIAEAARQGLETRAASARALESAAGKDNPQGILAILRQRHPKIGQITGLRVGVALVTPQDPGNIGAILRSLEAVGGDALFLLDGGADPFHPTCVRASMGALFWMPVVQTSFAEFAAWAARSRPAPPRLIGTSAQAETDYRAIEPDGPWILVLGSEQKGLAPDQLAACDVRVRLPMHGRSSSLNLAVAAGIFLYRFTEKK